MSPRGGGGRTLRSFTQDASVTEHRLHAGTLRRIVGFARPHRRLIAVFLVLILIGALAGAATPLLYREIIDRGIVPGDTGVVVALALAVAGLSIATAALGLVQRWLSARIGEGLVYDLRTRVYDHVQRMPVAFFSRTRTGALVSRLNGDVQGAQQAFTSTLSNVVGNVVGVAATLTAMMFLSWQITLLALVLLPVFVLPARWMGRRLAALTRERYELNAAIGHTMTDRFNVAGALLIKLFGRPDHESARFAADAARVRDIGVTTAVYTRVFMTSLGLVASLATAMVYGLGGLMTIGGELGVGTVVALATYLNRLYGPLTELSNVQVDVMTTLVSFERVLEVLDLRPGVEDRPGARPLPEGPLSVELDGVSFRYPSPGEVSLASLEAVAVLGGERGETVLHEVSFRVEPGRTIALVGPSGAGKTTIAGLVSRLHDVSTGAVRLGGVDVRDATQASVRRAVGVVSQDAHLLHDTLRANLLLALPEATEPDLIDALRRAQVWEVVQRMPDGLDTVVGDHGYRLSGGEKQRLAIARLLLKDPAVVVLDEATAHLDTESEVAVQRALRHALTGRTAIVIAHRLATVRDADEILVVDRGRIVEAGSHEELLAAGGRYSEMCRSQLGDLPARHVA